MALFSGKTAACNCNPDVPNYSVITSKETQNSDPKQRKLPIKPNLSWITKWLHALWYAPNIPCVHCIQCLLLVG